MQGEGQYELAVQLDLKLSAAASIPLSIATASAKALGSRFHSLPSNLYESCSKCFCSDSTENLHIAGHNVKELCATKNKISK